MEKRKDILSKIDEMITFRDGVIESLKKETERLLISGGINIENHEFKSYAIPKIILTVALENTAKQYYPFAESYIKDVKTLRHF